MPELPEVETVRSAIAPALEGRRLERVAIFDARLTRPHDPRTVAAMLEGECVSTVERRGKYVVLRFESGRVLLIHLRMTGSLLYVPTRSDGLPSHVRAVVTLDNGSDIVYRDVRRFGTWLVLEAGAEMPYLTQRLGEEPLLDRFTASALEAALANRRAPIKAALLDQRVVAGMGNIYADEALWRARIHPLRPARSLEPAEVRALHRAVRRALEAGISRQGATLRDYRTPDGRRGSMQAEFKAYGRTGKPCGRCRTPIEKTRVGGRGTWYCPACQPASR